MGLELRIAEAERATLNRGEVLNEAAKELNALRVIAGLEAATGPGVRARSTIRTTCCCHRTSSRW